jgi:thiamine pyrophosphokinase
MLNSYKFFQKLQKKLNTNKQYAEKFYTEIFNSIFPYNNGRDLIQISESVPFTLFNDMKNETLKNIEKWRI